uniref:Uncharacterized protein n=1 Tax=Cyanothece sp. (strain PCC 7425 / ATCC 29141) TaxID=395961 RepID=B8HKP8_CYAP4
MLLAVTNYIKTSQALLHHHKTPAKGLMLEPGKLSQNSGKRLDQLGLIKTENTKTKSKLYPSSIEGLDRLKLYLEWSIAHL